MKIQSRGCGRVNNAIKQIADLGGDDSARKLWKKHIGYHRRSIAETAMYRFKALLGEKLKCRKRAYQKAEVLSKYLIINRMNSIGMPKGRWIGV